MFMYLLGAFPRFHDLVQNLVTGAPIPSSLVLVFWTCLGLGEAVAVLVG